MGDPATSAQSEAQFRRVIEAAPDGIVVSRNGVVLFANPAAVTLLGYDAPSDLVGQSMGLFLDASEIATMRERITAMMRAGRALEPHEYAARRRDGTRVTAEITSLSIEWDGEPAIIALVRDVTERARLQAQLARADRLAALGTLAAGVAHEINNPLAYMALGLERLEELVSSGTADGATKSEALGAIAEIRGGADRVSAIVRDLRTFSLDSGPTPGDASSDISEVLAAVVRLVAHHVRHRANLRYDASELPRVMGSAHQLEQVFVNLVLNAAQAVDGHGESSEIILRAFAADDHRIAVEVKDNGPGIAADVLGRIFDPFFTTKPVNVGTGLGLAISHRIVTRLGGGLTAESEIGRGTTFRVTLPIAPSTTRVEASGAPALRKQQASRLRVLVVDDEPAIGRSIKNLFAKYDVQAVSSGELALARLRDDATFDVVICDLMMPLVTGMDVYAQIAAERPGYERRFVFITGGAVTERGTKFLAEMPNRCVDKPFSMTELEEAIEETVLQRSMQ